MVGFLLFEFYFPRPKRDAPFPDEIALCLIHNKFPDIPGPDRQL